MSTAGEEMAAPGSSLYHYTMPERDNNDGNFLVLSILLDQRITRLSRGVFLDDTCAQHALFRKVSAIDRTGPRQEHHVGND